MTTYLEPLSRAATTSCGRVLLIDPDASVTAATSDAFEMNGWEVRTATTGAGGMQVANEFDPTVVVLELALPDMSGLEVLQRLRHERSGVGILFLSNRKSLRDRLTALWTGADDIVSKPTSTSELFARAYSVARGLRPRVMGDAEELRVGGLRMNLGRNEVDLDGELLNLTVKEFGLLKLFMQNLNRVLPRDAVLAAIWQYDAGRESNVLPMYVSYLREKLRSAHGPRIDTVRGVGYVLRMRS